MLIAVPTQHVSALALPPGPPLILCCKGLESGSLRLPPELFPHRATATECGGSSSAAFPNPASRYPMVGVFVAKFPAGVRVAITGAGQNGVFRHAEFEAALSKSYTPEALDGLTTPADDLNGDIHASAPYRAHLIGVMAKRAVAAS